MMKLTVFIEEQNVPDTNNHSKPSICVCFIPRPEEIFSLPLHMKQGLENNKGKDTIRRTGQQTG